MIKVFIEYKVIADKQHLYLSLLPELRERTVDWDAKDFRVFEGTDQPLLFVEEYYVKDMDEYRRTKEERLSESIPFWHKLHDCIPGGAGKVHIWAFKEVG
jgi:hypothetical protein